MKKLSIFLIFGVSIALLLQTSCSIEKRHYRPGFYVDNGSHKNAKGTMVEKQAGPVVTINNTVAEAQSEPMSESKAQPYFPSKSRRTIGKHYTNRLCSQSKPFKNGG